MRSNSLLILKLASISNLSSSQFSTSPFLKPQFPLFKTLPISTSAASSAAAATNNSDAASLIPNITLRKLHLMLTDPHVKTSSCLQVFNYLKQNESNLSFDTDLRSHLTLICRLIRAKNFREAEIVLESVVIEGKLRYPFGSVANWVDCYCRENKIVIKLLSMVLKAYSENRMFDAANEMFEYMRKNGVWICERTCTGHLCALVENGGVGVAVEFFRGMVDSGMEVSVFSLTVVVKGLCGIGMMKEGRELVEEMVMKGIVRPNVVTCNTLVDACAKRWNFEELGFVIDLMRKEGVRFNDSTYKFLIDGYSSFGMAEEGERLVLEMHDKGFKVNSFLYATVIRGYFRSGNVEGGLSLFRRMKERGLSPSFDVYSILISDLCRLGRMRIVEQLVDEMQEKGGKVDEHLLNALIAGYQKSGMTDKALELQGILQTDRSDDGDEFPQSFPELGFSEEPG